MAWRLIRGQKRSSRTWLAPGIAITGLLALIGANPSVPGGYAPGGMRNLDVVIVVDRTASMSSLDYEGDKTRLDGVRQDLAKLVASLQGARMTLLTFGANTQVTVPFTTDSTSITQALSILDQEIALYAQGSALNQPVETLASLLAKEQAAHPTRGRLLFYVSDGEQTASQSVASFATLATRIDGGGVLGYGSEAGGKMKSYYGASLYGGSPLVGSQYVTDAQGEPALSRYDGHALEQIAAQLKVPYQHRISSDQALTTFFTDSHAEIIAHSHREVLDYIPMYWAGALLLVMVLLGWVITLLPVMRSGVKRPKEDQ